MKSAELFNQQGYVGTSMQDIMDATDLTKGALYRAFVSKDEIAVEAFRYAGEVLMKKFGQAMEGHDKAADKIMAICEVYQNIVEDPPLKGGCPLLNTAVESDHAYPVLRDETAAAYQRMVSFLQAILDQGVRHQELRAEIDTSSAASFLFSAMEGGIMASRLMKDDKHVRYAMQYIAQMLDSYKPYQACTE